MGKSDVLDWFQQHPDLVHGDVEEVLTRCEQAVRRHARQAAWTAAKRYVEQRRHDQEDHRGAHASEAYVAQEVCHQLADELLRHEPSPAPGDESQLAGRSVKAAIEGEGWEMLVPWILEVAREEEHRTWLEIARYTDERAKALIQEHHLSNATDFDRTKCYGEVAQQVERLLERDFDQHAHSG